ncbi:MAG TPA: hypothetical protein VIH93_09900, partial [Thermoanaerobaculia bacterium]
MVDCRLSGVELADRREMPSPLVQAVTPKLGVVLRLAEAGVEVCSAGGPTLEPGEGQVRFTGDGLICGLAQRESPLGQVDGSLPTFLARRFCERLDRHSCNTILRCRR